MTTTVFVNGVTLTDAGWFNDSDQLIYDQIVDIENSDFGAVGDGSTDDTAAFTAFQTYATALPSGYVARLWCHAGKTYTYTNPRWPTNIKGLIVYGNGCTFKNIATDNEDKELLIPSLGLDRRALGAGYTPSAFYLIGTTAIGNTTVTTSSAADAGNFSTNDWVAVTSFDQQFGGQPPNFRQFDYAKVLSADAGTGIITLDRRLKHAHRSDYPYLSTYTNGDGRASIHRLEQGTKWDIDHEYNDITFSILNSAGATSTIAAFLCGRRVTYRRCTAAYFLPTILGHGKLIDCIQTGISEVDKMVDLMEYEGGEYSGQISGATGCNKLRFVGSKLLAGFLWCPKELEMIDCDVRGAANSANLKDSTGFTERALIRGGTFESTPSFSITNGQTRSVTIDGVNVSWASPNLTVLITNDARKNFVAGSFIGQIIHVTQNSQGDRCTGTLGKVQSITGADGTATIQIDFNAALAGTEQLTIYSEPFNTQIDDVNIAGQRISLPHIRLARRKYVFKQRTLSAGLDGDNNITVCGRPTRLVVDVLRAYTGGTAGNILLVIQDLFPQFDTRFTKRIDLKTVGRRESTLTGNSGWTGAAGESAGANLTTTGAFSAAMISNLLILGPVTMAGTTDQLPIVQVEIELEHPHFRHVS